MKKEEVIDEYEYVCNLVLEKINNIYFEGEADVDWVGNEVGGVATVADYFFDMNTMVIALRYNATEKQFFDYYDMTLEDEKPKMNFKNYILHSVT